MRQPTTGDQGRVRSDLLVHNYTAFATKGAYHLEQYIVAEVLGMRPFGLRSFFAVGFAAPVPALLRRLDA